MLGQNATYILNHDINIPIEDKSVDVVIAWGCFFLNWREKIIKLMQEVRRALKDDGEIFCNFRTQRDDMYCHSEKYGEFIEKDTLLLKKRSNVRQLSIFYNTCGIKETIINILSV